MQVIYQEINARVKKAIDRELTRDNYETYLVPLWINKAKEFRDEMAAEGLDETVKAIQEIIDYTVERQGHRQGNEAKIIN